MPTVAAQLASLAERMTSRRSQKRQRNPLSFLLADALSWTAEPARAEEVAVPDFPFDVTRGLLGGQTAAIFVSSRTPRNGSTLDLAAFYGYHVSVPWGVYADNVGVVVFNSQCVREDHWFHLPRIPWERTSDHLEVLEAVTPDAITSGLLDRVAFREQEPDRLLRRVDDALLERLDHWRLEALRFTKASTGVDEKLQHLFAQLFVLRTVEDRKLDPAMPSLQTALRSQQAIDTRALAKLFDLAKQHVGSELFDLDVLEHIPPHVLAGVIHDLYVPRRLPGSAGRYNFAWIDADILGLAYEKYLSTVLSPLPIAPQLEFFNQPEREVERISVRRAGGVYYTPPFLSRYIVERCIDLVFEDFEDDLPRIADFACGSGSFLVAAIDVLIRKLRQRDPNRNWARKIITGKHIIGVDIDEKAVTMARLNLWQRLTEEPQPLPLPRLSEVIVQGDSLGTEVWARIPTQYDIVLGNPPFLATGRIPSREELAKRFKTAQGRFDFSYLFIELGLSRLSVNGVLGLVVPNRLFRNRDAGTIRGLLTREADLLTIIDFGANEVFEGTNAYIGTIVVRKRSEGTSRAKSVRVIQVENVDPSFIAAVLLRADHASDEMTDTVLRAFDAAHPVGETPWVLLSASAKRSRTKIEDASQLLGSIAGIFQGIRTGANDIFIVQLDSTEARSIATVINGLGEAGILEPALLHPVIFGTEIQRYDIVGPTKYLIYPYRHGRAIPEPELRDRYPKTFAYLSRYRDLLASRSSIQASGLRWYEIVRKRDEAWLTQPKLLIRDLAMETAFAIDDLGSTFLVGGTAVVPAERSLLLPLMAYLNSRMVNDYLSEITPLFNRGFQKFEPQHLQRIPILNQLLGDGEVSQELSRLALAVLKATADKDINKQQEAEDMIETIVRKAAGLHEVKAHA